MAVRRSERRAGRKRTATGKAAAMQSILPDGIADGLWSNDLERNLYQEEELEQAQLPGRTGNDLTFGMTGQTWQPGRG